MGGGLHLRGGARIHQRARAVPRWQCLDGAGDDRALFRRNCSWARRIGKRTDRVIAPHVAGWDVGATEPVWSDRIGRARRHRLAPLVRIASANCLTHWCHAGSRDTGGMPCVNFISVLWSLR